jgi:hypothetical protein
MEGKDKHSQEQNAKKTGSSDHHTRQGTSNTPTSQLSVRGKADRPRKFFVGEQHVVMRVLTGVGNVLVDSLLMLWYYQKVDALIVVYSLLSVHFQDP